MTEGGISSSSLSSSVCTSVDKKVCSFAHTRLYHHSSSNFNCCIQLPSVPDGASSLSSCSPTPLSVVDKVVLTARMFMITTFTLTLGALHRFLFLSYDVCVMCDEQTLLPTGADIPEEEKRTEVQHIYTTYAHTYAHTHHT